MPNSASSHASVALTAPAAWVIDPASLADAGPASAAPSATTAPSSDARRSSELRRGTRPARSGRLVGGCRGCRRRLHLVGLSLLEALLGPRLVELDAHPALLVL